MIWGRLSDDFWNRLLIWNPLDPCDIWNAFHFQNCFSYSFFSYFFSYIFSSSFFPILFFPILFFLLFFPVFFNFCYSFSIFAIIFQFFLFFFFNCCISMKRFQRGWDYFFLKTRIYLEKTPLLVEKNQSSNSSINCSFF